MGTYTELIFGASLKKNTPPEIIETIKYLLNMECDKSIVNKKIIEQRNVLTISSYYFGVCKAISKFWYDEIGKEWILSSRANIKNYESEIETFLEWIKPHIYSGSGESNFYAIVMYENANIPKIYYLDDLEEQ